MGYTAGTLDLSIFGVSDDAVKSISNVEKSLNSLSRSIQIFAKTDINKTFSKLAESVNIFSQSAKNLDVSGFEKLSVIGTTGKGINSLANAINKLNASSTVFATQQISNLFEKLSISSQKIDATALSNLSSIGKSLSSISNISRLDKIDWDKAGQGFNKLATAITPFLNKIKEAEASLTALYGILSKSSGKKIGGLLDGSTKSTKSSKNVLSRILRLGSWTAVLYTARRLGRVVADIATAGSDFGETLNLWKVAMGNEFLPQATEFVNKLNEAYGISKETLMNSQAIFKNMLGSLGEISSEQAYQLSEGITQMALDYASLYNVQFEDAMTKFQAALAGQVRPIRSVSGYDITENTLFQLYQELGGEKTMRQLSRTEKQLLAIYAVFEQMDRSGATGDLSNTLHMWANQSRVMKDTWSDIMTYAGLTVTRLLDSIGFLKYVNAVLIFISRILEGLAASLDTGLDTELADPFEEVEEGANDTSDAIDGTTEAVEDLQNALLDFDKFRALDSKNTVSDHLGLDKNILDAMKEYDGILEGASLEARKLADSWLDSLGFVDANKDGIIDIENGIIGIKEKWDSIKWGEIGTKISDAIKDIKFDELITNLTNAFSDAVNNLSDLINGVDFTILGNNLVNILVSPNLWIALWNLFVSILRFIWGVLTAIYEFLYGIVDTIVKGLNIDNFFMDLLSVFEGTDFYNWLFGQYWRGGEDPHNKYQYSGVGIGGGKNLGGVSGGSRRQQNHLPDSDSLFNAEGATSQLYTVPNVQNTLEYNTSIAQATYNGTIKALNDWWGGSGAKSDIPQLKEANATGMYQAVTGVAHQYGKDWSRF